ncbi:hypothetical protein GPECTOR_91g549 [Gonium pectorale]|uniref:Uncharacterized protein n=1 Tax=Gonium pectorale TaxID=33097 RepID=A0A150G1M9_GONPE|nr:hypothetical protein GPECTOR_91g549 [Gonium pectorale]|eukprot:KXZ43395.1 hypothetical protein GPECTOR_91g549 [Gonium pectorale]
MEPLPAAALGPISRKLYSEGPRWQNWRPETVDELVAILAGRVVIAASGANADGLAAFEEIRDELEALLTARPEIAQKVDPVYVQADPATGAGAPGALKPPAPPLNMPASMPPLRPLGASGCMWVFPGGAAGRQAASYLAGALRASNPPGLVVRVFSTQTPVDEFA